MRARTQVRPSAGYVSAPAVRMGHEIRSVRRGTWEEEMMTRRATVRAHTGSMGGFQ